MVCSAVKRRRGSTIDIAPRKAKASPNTELYIVLPDLRRVASFHPAVSVIFEVARYRLVV
eukprot:207715-Ditylum_brightwellii.AAC.1